MIVRPVLYEYSKEEFNNMHVCLKRTCSVVRPELYEHTAATSTLQLLSTRALQLLSTLQLRALSTLQLLSTRALQLLSTPQLRAHEHCSY